MHIWREQIGDKSLKSHETDILIENIPHNNMSYYANRTEDQLNLGVEKCFRRDVSMLRAVGRVGMRHVVHGPPAIHDASAANNVCVHISNWENQQ